ncbi:hypothetical protein OAF27_03215 [Verrucomicrobiales bacterium]|nr:hypothetical protein [Verrucomicrobiales bacterium]
MNRFIIVLLLLSMVSTGAELTCEQKLEKRLHSILGTESIEKDTWGGRLTMVDIADDSRESVYGEVLQIFRHLQRLGTHEAVRVIIGFIDDDRHIIKPGSDYGSPTISDKVARALESIRKTHPENVVGVSPQSTEIVEVKEGMDIKEWIRLERQSWLEPWRKWWTINKDSYGRVRVEDSTPK